MRVNNIFISISKYLENGFINKAELAKAAGVLKNPLRILLNAARSYYRKKIYFLSSKTHRGNHLATCFPR